MNNSPRRLALTALFALSFGAGCYGANPGDSVVQEAALCGEDLLVPTNYTCTRALTNIGTSGSFDGVTYASTDGRTLSQPGNCLITCECTWDRISPDATCGANRFADGASVPTCTDHTETRHLLTILPNVASAAACTELGRRPTSSCAQVCQLSATDPYTLSQAPSGLDALQRLDAAGTPVVVPNGAPILDERSEVMYCCAPHPLRRSAPQTDSTEGATLSTVQNSGSRR